MKLQQQKQYYALPSLPRESIVLNPQRSYLGVILPEESVNLLPDPEFLAFASGYSVYDPVGGASLAATAFRQRRGLYSVIVEDTDVALSGISYSPFAAMQPDVPNTFSVDHFGHGRYILAIINRTTGLPLAQTRFEGKGFWQRVHVTAIASATILIDLQILTEGSGAEYSAGFYTDGWQLERKAYPTTFISGALTGFEGESPNPYGWIGPPHNSASFRRALTRSGGREMPFNELGLDIYEIEGLGLGGIEHAIQSYALEHGGAMGCSRLTEREFTLTGEICGIGGVVDLHCMRRNITGALNPLFGRPSQPVRLTYQLYDCKEAMSSKFYIDALYNGGLEFSLSNPHAERVDLDLIAPDPFIYEFGTSASELSVPDAFLDAVIPGIPARGESGEWRLTKPQVTTHSVMDFEIGPDGYMYALTGFLGATYFQRFDGFEWSVVLSFAGVGASLGSSPDGYVYIVGDFAVDVGDDADSIMRYNVVTGDFDTLANTTVVGNDSLFTKLSAIVYHPSGRMILGGGFDGISNDNGSIVCNNVAAYNITTNTWEMLGLEDTEGIPDNTGSVVTLAVSPAGHIIAGGRFSAQYADILYSMENLAYYDIDANDQWRFVDDVRMNDNYHNATVYSVRYAPNGNLYVGGRFNDTLANNYTGTLGDTSADGIHHPLTNIGYFTELSGDLSGLAGNFGPIIPRMRPIQNGTSESFCQGLINVGPSPDQDSCPEDAPLRLSHIYDIAISCDGDIWVGGDFNLVVGEKFLANRFEMIPAVAVARISSNHHWVPSDIVFLPNGYRTATTPFFSVNALEFGSRCDPVGFISLFGAGTPGPGVPGNDTGVPADYAESLFVGIVIGEPEAPYVLFPRRTVVNTKCSEDSRPIIRVQGPGRLRSVRNSTIGVEVSFNDYVLLVGEVLTIDLAGRIPNIYSNRTGRNAFDSVTNLAQVGKFYLVGGENDIDLTINNLGFEDEILAGTRAWIEWIPRYASVDAACASDCQR